MKDIVPKKTPTVNFARTSVLYFPGKSLQNARIGNLTLGNITGQSTDLPSVYFHPLTSNFPTHDSFVVCKASDWFEANSQSTEEDQLETNKKLANRYVLVGLQLTVSGSDNGEDKPSHTVVGQHLANHLKGFRKIVERKWPNVTVLDDVVTVFISAK